MLVRAMFSGALAVVFSLTLLSCPGPSTARLHLELVAEGFEQPTYVTSLPADASRLFVLERASGLVWMIAGQQPPEVFLDLSDNVGADGGEQGLLGLAFHPDFAANGYLYVNYTDLEGDTVVERYTVPAGAAAADPATAKTILTVDQPEPNHNGGMLAFGPDGYLYISLGDGGGANDPNNNAQDLSTLLGSILRIDVDTGDPYAIPPDNPFVEMEEARPEIWAYGLRNPWRFSFDRQTGDLWIADVGQGAREEVNFQPASSDGGENYGWKVREGSICRPGQNDCDLPGAVEPVYDYGKLISQSITGGYVYRGPADIPALYFFADFAAGDLSSLRFDGSSVIETRDYISAAGSISSFGEDAEGNLYVVDFIAGEIFRVTGIEGE